jgi:hypothetical protein
MKHPTEHEDQKAVFAFCRQMSSIYPALGLIYAIPNGFRASAEACKWMKDEGMRPGFPDLGLPTARGGYHGMFIEMKRKGGPKPRPEQSAWLQALADEGYYTCCCKGREAAQKTLIKYITGEILRA